MRGFKWRPTRALLNVTPIVPFVVMNHENILLVILYFLNYGDHVWNEELLNFSLVPCFSHREPRKVNKKVSFNAFLQENSALSAFTFSV